MDTRYQFYNIFGKNQYTQDIFPLFNMRVNGQFFQQFVSIPRGLSFGGLDIYRLEGRDFGGVWDAAINTLALTTIY